MRWFPSTDQRVALNEKSGRWIWRCDGCRREGFWGPTWSWFGSLLEADSGHFRRVLCGQCPERPTK